MSHTQHGSIKASRIASEIASHILSGCPSVTDSEVNNLFSIVTPFDFKQNKSPLMLSGLDWFTWSNPLIARFTRSGWHLPALSRLRLTGVAVTSPVLCTSITLNKGYCELF